MLLFDHTFHSKKQAVQLWLRVVSTLGGTISILSIDNSDGDVL